MGMILGLLLILLVLALFLLHVWLSMRKSPYMGLLFPFIVGLAAIYRYVGTVYHLYLNLRGYHLWKSAMIWYELQGELTSAVGLIPVGLIAFLLAVYLICRYWRKNIEKIGYSE